jgi:hypothetical protein
VSHVTCGSSCESGNEEKEHLPEVEKFCFDADMMCQPTTTTPICHLGIFLLKHYSCSIDSSFHFDHSLYTISQFRLIDVY